MVAGISVDINNNETFIFHILYWNHTKSKRDCNFGKIGKMFALFVIMHILKTCAENSHHTTRV
jgi:hypothetical protein